jgi:hypothetical protein
MRPSWLVIGGLLLGGPSSLAAQQLRLDPATVLARAALRSDLPEAVARAPMLITADTTVQPRRSRAEAAALGFLAGAAAGLVVAHVVNHNRSEGRLENYIGIPLGLGVFAAATVLVATAD